MSRRLLIAAAFGLASGLALTGLVFVLGLSFGQRCERSYPNDGAAQESCVRRLVKGDRP